MLPPHYRIVPLLNGWVRQERRNTSTAKIEEKCNQLEANPRTEEYKENIHTLSLSLAFAHNQPAPTNTLHRRGDKTNLFLYSTQQRHNQNNYPLVWSPLGNGLGCERMGRGDFYAKTYLHKTAVTHEGRRRYQHNGKHGKPLLSVAHRLALAQLGDKYTLHCIGGERIASLVSIATSAS